MKSIVSLSALGGAFALSSDHLDFVAPKQQSLLQGLCPSHSILNNGECQPATYDSINPEASTFQSNTSHILQSLDESRKSAAQIENFPWTFWPECFSNEKTIEPYCVFSDQKFASGRGIFIVTTQTLAYAMRERVAFTESEVLSRVNQYSNPPFIQHEFPGKGRGLVANKTLQRGDHIFSSTPLLITDGGAYDLSDSERLALLYRGVESLPPASRERFWELLGHFDDDPVEDRINTNNFEVILNDISHSAVFPEIAMLNHDCRPNAAYFFDDATLTHYVHAIRTIQPGEEITITYIDNEKERAKRMSKLERNWGFKCSCSSCTAHQQFTFESDSRLHQISDLLEILDDWTAESHATPEVAELLVSLYTMERLDASLSLAYKHAAEVYSSFGKRYEAIKYARLSAEMSMLDKGFSDSDVKEMRKMSREPEMTWSWNKRVGLKSSCGCGGHGH